MVGSNNDITVFRKFNLFIPCIRGESARHKFIVGGKFYNLSYYLVDGVYPKVGESDSGGEEAPWVGK